MVSRSSIISSSGADDCSCVVVCFGVVVGVEYCADTVFSGFVVLCLVGVVACSLV